MVSCSFGSVRERDMDLLFLEAVISDHGFAKMIVDRTDLSDSDFEVVKVELSHTEPNLGESDITVIIKVDHEKYGLLIEDKIDAIAMPDQHSRYHKRGQIGIQRGDYKNYYIFIFCPEQYRSINSEARKYEHFISYQEFHQYLDSRTDLLSRAFAQQITQAISKYNKPYEAHVNESANLFFNHYKAFQREHYPKLVLRTGDNTSGWWPHYSTNLGAAYILHKMSTGTVDLTFPDAGENMDTLYHIASWLSSNDTNKIRAVRTGKSGALRIEVPPIDSTTAFDDIDRRTLHSCFDAISFLSEFADIVNVAETISGKSNSSSKA